LKAPNRDKDSSVSTQALTSLLSSPNICLRQPAESKVQNFSVTKVADLTVRNIQPKISIITPTMQRPDMLRELLGNLTQNGCVMVEHIVVDAEDGSESSAIAAGYENVRVIPGPDRNSHHAMNKGIASARGEILGFVNTDDRLQANSLIAVQAHFEQHPDCVMLRTGCYLAPLGTPPGEEPLELYHLDDDPGLLSVLLFGTPGFNAWFFRKEFLVRFGSVSDDGAVLDERYSVAADRDLLLRLYLAGFRPSYLPVPVYVYGLHEASATLDTAGSGAETILAEHTLIAARLRTIAGPLGVELDAWGALEFFSLARRRWRSGKRLKATAMLAHACRASPKFPLQLLRGVALRAALKLRVRRERGAA
jgi:hypothetical protein